MSYFDRIEQKVNLSMHGRASEGMCQNNVFGYLIEIYHVYCGIVDVLAGNVALVVIFRPLHKYGAPAIILRYID